MAKGTKSKPQSAFDTFRQVTTNETRKKKDFLYLMVKMIGPTIVGEYIDSNSDTIWSRVENPNMFRHGEIKVYKNALDITYEEFSQILDNQEEHNKTERKHGRPIGRARYLIETGKTPRTKTSKAASNAAGKTGTKKA